MPPFPPGVYVELITIVLTLSSTLEIADIDDAAKDELAAFFTGVSQSAVHVAVRAGSAVIELSIDTSLSPSDTEATITLVNTLNGTISTNMALISGSLPGATFMLLGIPLSQPPTIVIRTRARIVRLSLPPSASPSPSPPPQDGGNIYGPAAGGGVGGLILAVGFALALVIYRKQKQATKSVTKDVDGVDRRSSDQKLLIDMAAFDAPLASSRKDPPPSVRKVAQLSKRKHLTDGEAAIQLQRFARGKAAYKGLEARKAEGVSARAETVLDNIDAIDLTTSVGRRDMSKALEEARRQKEEARIIREQAEAKRKKEETERLRVELARQAKQRLIEEERLVVEAVELSERQAREKQAAIVIARHVRVMLARHRFTKMRKRRTLKNADHIDHAISAGRGRAKLAEMRQQKTMMEAFIAKTRAKAKPQKPPLEPPPHSPSSPGAKQAPKPACAASALPPAKAPAKALALAPTKEPVPVLQIV